MEQAERPRPYLLFILILSLLALAGLALEAVAPLDASSRRILSFADTAICVLFFLDFLVCLYRAKNLSVWAVPG